MPAGFGYGAVGGALLNVMKGGARGFGGRTMQGAVIGAGLGGAYGAVSDRQTILGGMMGGAFRGAALGFAATAIPRTLSASRALGAARSAAGMGGGFRMGDIAAGLRSAGKAEWRSARAFADRSARLIGGTWRNAANPISGMTAAAASKPAVNMAKAVSSGVAGAPAVKSAPIPMGPQGWMGPRDVRRANRIQAIASSFRGRYGAPQRRPGLRDRLNTMAGRVHPALGRRIF